MNTFEIALMITVVILFITVVVLIGIISHYKNKYYDTRHELNFEIDYKNTKIDDLQRLVDCLQETIKRLQEEVEEPERVFKIEKVVMTLKEITCKFEISNRLTIKDAECLKRHAFDALTDYIIREYDNDPNLFNIQQKQDYSTDSTHFELRVRLLPYPEQSDTFETLCEEMEEQS